MIYVFAYIDGDSAASSRMISCLFICFLALLCISIIIHQQSKRKYFTYPRILEIFSFQLFSTPSCSPPFRASLWSMQNFPNFVWKYVLKSKYGKAGQIGFIICELIRERTMEGLASARARGRMGGRPGKDKKTIDQALTLYESKAYSVDEISKTTGISRATLHKYVNLRKEEKSEWKWGTQ